MTTNKIPKSFSPINNIAKGTHATLGKDCNPTAKELIVFPNPGNFTMANPTATPVVMDIANPITRRYIVIAILVTNVKSCNKLAKDSATIAGDGIDTLGHMPSMNTNCQIPIKTAMNKVILDRSSRSIFLTGFFGICCC
jgi:hypothetical protein